MTLPDLGNLFILPVSDFDQYTLSKSNQEERKLDDDNVDVFFVAHKGYL